MKTKKLTLNSILLAIGLILHQVTPALGLPMQPDFALAMLFVIMLLNKEDYKICMVCAIVTGVFTALTTKFPGGQLPNILDKVVTANCVYILILLFNKKDKFLPFIILPIGTLISGFVFLGFAKIIAGLPAPFLPLFLTVVVPACIINLFAGLFLYKVVKLSLKRTSSF
ncbi:MAG: tryptophan transporter [Paraclostridium sp.]|uniref:tryptophan transporter n=1 Tax=Paraclostridium sp. TaxID=2023273 RepID=UPI003F30DA99